MSAKLSRGRAPCSSATWKQNRMIVVGGADRCPGEVLSATDSRKELPSCPGGWSLAPSCIALLNDRYLYAVLTYASTQELYVADMESIHNQWMIARVIHFLFFPFWKRVVPMEAHNSSIVAAQGTIYAVGGFYHGAPTSSWGLFSTSTKKKEVASSWVRKLSATSTHWNRLPEMIHARKDLATVVFHNYLYAIGGKDATGKSMASVERLDLSNVMSRWEEVAPMSTPRDSFGAVVVNETTIVVAGGYCNNTRLKSVEYFDLAGWRALPDLMEPRSNCSLAVLDSQLVVAGGLTGFGIVPLDTIETLNILEYSEPAPAVPVAEDNAIPLPHATAVLQAATTPSQAGQNQLAKPVYNKDDDQPARTAIQPSAPSEELVLAERDNCCAVCLERPKQVAFLCGHQACLVCSPLLSECHSCRQPIQGRIQLFG